MVPQKLAPGCLLWLHRKRSRSPDRKESGRDKVKRARSYSRSRSRSRDHERDRCMLHVGNGDLQGLYILPAPQSMAARQSRAAGMHMHEYFEAATIAMTAHQGGITDDLYRRMRQGHN